MNDSHYVTGYLLLRRPPPGLMRPPLVPCAVPAVSELVCLLYCFCARRFSLGPLSLKHSLALHHCPTSARTARGSRLIPVHSSSHRTRCARFLSTTMMINDRPLPVTPLLPHNKLFARRRLQLLPLFIVYPP